MHLRGILHVAKSEIVASRSPECVPFPSCGSQCCVKARLHIRLTALSRDWWQREPSSVGIRGWLLTLLVHTDPTLKFFCFCLAGLPQRVLSAQNSGKYLRRKFPGILLSLAQITRSNSGLQTHIRRLSGFPQGLKRFSPYTLTWSKLEIFPLGIREAKVATGCIFS